MNREIELRVLQVFEQAMGLTGSQLESFLDHACADSTEVLDRVKRMLKARPQAEGMMRVPELALTTNREFGTASQAASFGIGTKLINRYRLEVEIGSGGMGVVYRGFDERLDRPVAIKTLHYAGINSDEMQARFDREMKAVAGLSHPNIVTLYDFADHDGLRFAVMELITGKTLRQLIGEEASLRKMLQCIRDVLQGLDCAHARNLMHRDIKPENVILDTAGRGKVLDFGIARPESFSAEQDITSGGPTPGTAPYMSPEQALGHELTCATDLFSVGTMLYEVVVGVNPFRGSSLLDTLKRVSAATPDSLQAFDRAVPEELDDLIMAMLDVDPSRRPKAEQAALQLSTFLVELGEDTKRITPQLIERDTKQSEAQVTRRKRRWQPSLIILPFQSFTSDDQLEATADGLVENLTTVLTRVPMLSLVSRMSSFSLKGTPVTAADVRRRFGVEYMIEGSLQRVGESIRANVQLIETNDGFHLWAQSFDVASSDDPIKDLLDQTLARLEPQVIRAIFNDLRDESGDLSSRQLVIQAMTVLTLKGWHRDTFTEVAELLRRSINLEPDLALAHAYLSLIRGLGKRVGLVADPEDAKREAIKHADRAIDLDQFDSNVLGIAGCALSDVGQTGRAIPILKNAITINDRNAQAEAALGAAYLMIDDLQQAVEHLRTGIELSPLDSRLAVWYALLAMGHLGLEDSDNALTSAESGCQADRKNYMPRVVLTAIRVARGEQQLAKDAMRDCLSVKPDLTNEEIQHLVGRPLGLRLRRLRRAIDNVS